MLPDYPTRLIYCQNEVNPLLPSFIVYNHILEVRTSPNRTQRNIIVYEEIQNKMKAVDALYLSVNDRISAHTITELYDRNTRPCETLHLSDYDSVCLAKVNIDNGLMILGKNPI